MMFCNSPFTPRLEVAASTKSELGMLTRKKQHATDHRYSRRYYCRLSAYEGLISAAIQLRRHHESLLESTALEVLCHSHAT